MKKKSVRSMLLSAVLACAMVFMLVAPTFAAAIDSSGVHTADAYTYSTQGTAPPLSFELLWEWFTEYGVANILRRNDIATLVELFGPIDVFLLPDDIDYFGLYFNPGPLPAWIMIPLAEEGINDVYTLLRAYHGPDAQISLPEFCKELSYDIIGWILPLAATSHESPLFDINGTPFDVPSVTWHFQFDYAAYTHYHDGDAGFDSMPYWMLDWIMELTRSTGRCCDNMDRTHTRVSHHSTLPRTHSGYCYTRVTHWILYCGNCRTTHGTSQTRDQVSHSFLPIGPTESWRIYTNTTSYCWVYQFSQPSRCSRCSAIGGSTWRVPTPHSFSWLTGRCTRSGCPR